MQSFLHNFTRKEQNTERTGFTEVSKNLSRYRSKNNFAWTIKI